MASTGEPWRLGRRPALDGLRGVAILMVLASHLKIPGAGLAGAAGVVVFFALSGFLITSLLIEHRTRLGDFYRRRAARLLPPLLACLVVYTLAEAVLLGHLADGIRVLGALTYTANWVQAGTHVTASGIGHLWSLAIEEQFYLIWPFAVPLLLRLPRRWSVFLLGAAFAAGLQWSLHLWTSGATWGRIYFGTDVRANELLIGAALAFGMVHRRCRRITPWVAVLALAGLVALSWTTGAIATLLLPPAAALLTVPVLYVAVTGELPWLQLGWLVWVGRRSYSIYLFHPPLLFIVEALVPGLAWELDAVIVVTLAFLLAELSWRYLEQPAQAWARRRESGRASSGASVLPLGSTGAAPRSVA